MAEFQVDIVTPTQLAFSGEAAEVRAPGWEGQVGLLPEHDNYLTLLRAGMCIVTTAYGEKKYVVGRGFAKSTDKSVTILVDSCVAAEEVEKAAAKGELTQAEKDLEQANIWSEKARGIEARYELARAKIEA